MTDLVERLRTQEVDLFRLQDEAADEIESLRARVAELEEAAKKIVLERSNHNANLREQLDASQARVAELEEWNRQMVEKAASGGVLDGYRELGQKLAAMTQERDFYLGAASRAHSEAAISQHREQKLREALEFYASHKVDEGFCAREALALPTDTSALDAYVEEKLAEEKQLRRGIEAFYAGAVIDAKRYRWLRDSESLTQPSVDLASDLHYAATTESIDAAIDAAMKKEKL